MGSVNLELWSQLLAIVVPIILSFLMQSRWSSRTKYFAAISTSVGLSVLGMAYQGQLVWGADPVQTVIAVVTSSQGIYHMLNRGGWLDALNRRTDLPADPS